MRRSILIFTLFLVSVLAYAQPSGKCVVTGKVLDFVNKNPVEFATISVLEIDSSLVTGTISTVEGKFAVTDILPGNYILQVTFIGYERKYLDIALSQDKPTLKLETIFIKEASLNLETVTVTAEKPLVENKIDRKVFNVSQSIAATSANATEILKQVPSVSVDAEGTVSLRGNENVVFLINGKPSSISGENQANILQQMPANMIENVEVITNPSAKYDPEGVTGIININLKKNAKLGWNGSAGFNTSYNNKYNGQLNLGYNSGKVNIYGSYSGRHEERRGNGYKKTFSTKNSITASDQDSSKDQHDSHMGRLGLDYMINDQNSIGFVSSLMYRERIDFDWTHRQKDLLNLYNDVFEHSYGINTDNNLYYVKKFAKPKQELKFSALYNDSRSNRPISFSGYDKSAPQLIQYQKEKTASYQASQAIQADYTHPFTSNIALDAGWKSSFNQIDNDRAYDSLVEGAWKRIENQSYGFNFQEQVHATYLSFRMDTGKFGYQIGLRGEYYKREFTGTQTYGKSIPQLYPTMHLQYKLTQSQDLQLSYSKRVKRPSPQHLNPITRYYNATSWSRGNPYLDAEYVNSFEFGHLLKGVKNSLTTNVFYSYTENGITRNTEIVFDSILNMPRNLTTYENLQSSNSYGMEMTGIYYVKNWWFLNANASLFHYQIKGKGTTKESFNTHFKLISNMTIPKVINVQLSGFYRSGMISLQSEMKPFYTIDAALRKDVLKGKGSVSLTISDIFNTMKFRMNTSTESSIQEMYRKRESRIIFLGFVYRFGQPVKRKIDRPQQENGAGGGVDIDQML